MLSIMRASLLVCRIVCGVCSTFPLSAQSPGGSPQRADTTFRAATRLVQVNVVVHDRDGQAVPGLTSSDFTVFEDGKAQPIELFLGRIRYPAGGTGCCGGRSGRERAD